MGLADGLWSACSCDYGRSIRDDWCYNTYREVWASPRVHSTSPSSKRRSSEAQAQLLRRLETLTEELFQLHDLNGDGMLEESELVCLNEQIALLHHGEEADTAAVRSKYMELFRVKLDPYGRPVAYPKFRGYAREVLEGLDTDPQAQEMILEQFVEEARSGRRAFALPGGSMVGEPDPGGSTDSSPRGCAPQWRSQRSRVAPGYLACCWS